MLIPQELQLSPLYDLRAASSLVKKGGFCKGVMSYQQAEG